MLFECLPPTMITFRVQLSPPAKKLLIPSWPSTRRAGYLETSKNGNSQGHSAQICIACRDSMVLGSVIITMISRCAWMSEGVCVGTVTSLLRGAGLLLSTEVHELLVEEADWMAFAILLVSWRMTTAAFPACDTSFVIEFVSFVTAFVSWLIRIACYDTTTARCAVVAVVWAVSAVIFIVFVVVFKIVL